MISMNCGVISVQVLIVHISCFKVIFSFLFLFFSTNYYFIVKKMFECMPSNLHDLWNCTNVLAKDKNLLLEPVHECPAICANNKVYKSVLFFSMQHQLVE